MKARDFVQLMGSENCSRRQMLVPYFPEFLQLERLGIAEWMAFHLTQGSERMPNPLGK